MYKMDYTKAPWLISESGLTIETAHSPDGHVIASMNDIGNKVQADARLIAKAPKMYEALKDVYEGTDCDLDHHGYCQEHGWLQDGLCPQFRIGRILSDINGGENK